MVEVKPVEIVVDSREASSRIGEALSALPGVSVQTAELSSGDYLVAPGVAVERKEALDLIASILDRRLFEQVGKMLGEHDRAIVLVEGDPYKTGRDVAVEAIDGALAWLACLSGVHVMYSPSLAVTPRLLWRMAVQLRHGLGYEIPLRGNKPKQPWAQAQFIVEGLPGVGPTTARALVAHFGSARAVLCASEEDLRAVKGVGPKTAASIVQALVSGI